MTRSQNFLKLLDRILQIIVLVYQTIALVAFVVIVFLAITWLKTPFLGAFVEQTMVFNGVGQGEPPEAWGLFLDKTLNLKYRLVQVDGDNVTSEADVRLALEDRAPGDSVSVMVREVETGITATRIVTLSTLPQRARWAYLYIPYLVGLIYLCISLWIFGLRRNEASGRSFALFCTSMALAAAGLFDLYTTHALSWLWTLAVAMAGGAALDMALVFPQEVRWAVNRPYLRWIGYGIALVLTVLAWLSLYNYSRPLVYIVRWRWEYIFAALSFIILILILVYRWLASPSPVVRRQAGTILAGMLVSFGPLAGWLFYTAINPQNFPSWLFLPTIIFPVVTGYTILRQRLLRTDHLARIGVLYAFLSVLVLGAYALLVAGLGLFFGEAFKVYSPYLLGLLVFLLALVLNPLRNRLQRLIDTTFFRGEVAYQRRVEEFTHTLTNIVNLNAILRTLRQYVLNNLLPDRLHIFVFDSLNDQYTAAPGEDGRPTTDIRFTSASPVVQTLTRQRMPLFIDRITLPAGLQSEQSRLALLGTILFVPLPGERLTGWLALGPRRSGENYSGQDLNFLDLLASQASVAIERAQVIDNMEHRVREMNILSRVAQGVNVTVAFDDILELIYAQTSQILPVDDLYITLYNKEANYYYFAFCLENDDRLTKRENTPLPPTVGLGTEIIRSGKSILTADYSRECQAHGVTPDLTGIFAWVGVPLNAGAETIGSLSVSSRDPASVYTSAQLELLQSVADQAAGAIVKARLLQETEQRAHQLTTLNEITRQLTGTLETEPLLQRILESAVTILNCEAGSLFLVDEQTDELIFKVAVSPVANELVGRRLPPGTGIVGRAVQTRAPVIENDAQRSAAHFTGTDKQTGFVSKTLLAVPLQVKERVIGVLEVINRKDGLPFVEDDQNLLTAFAGQAAVAIENARLYTLTDQELSVRVEELSVMQRIDRELNASLDVTRAMRITLDWAMRQSAADAGLVGILEEKGLRMMAQVGYDDLQSVYKDAPLPLEQPAMRAAVETGQPQRIVLEEEQRGLLPDARSQVAVPIRRETNVIGLILMESRSPDSQPEEAVNFLTRLSDHAAIAIANAQLYTEVQAANLAKSEFVSFVAHELKNPMTSIKGYTELLAAGSVGQINEMQSNFLNTIRSNVERMSTLVSDLNDNSKIEAGRLKLDFRAVDLNDVVDEVIRSIKRQTDEKKQTIAVNLPSNLPKIWADRTRLAQVLTNLCSNAYKYTPESGQFTIAAERAKNKWDAEGAAHVAHIWVKDNGIGISLEDQKKIFQKFFRSDDSKAREAPGTGLGLNITRSLVEMQGGRIWFESEFRQGTAFHFTVPMAEG